MTTTAIEIYDKMLELSESPQSWDALEFGESGQRSNSL
jgi:hypothetical protein